MDQEKISEAREFFLKALELEPEQWSETACWLDAAIGDSYYQEGHYEEALKYFQDAYYAIGRKLNPYILFMNGMCYFKMGKIEEEPLNENLLTVGRNNCLPYQRKKCLTFAL